MKRDISIDELIKQIDESISNIQRIAKTASNYIAKNSPNYSHANYFYIRQFKNRLKFEVATRSALYKLKRTQVIAQIETKS